MKHKTYLAYLVLAVIMTGCLKVQNKDEVAAAKAAPKAKTPVAQPKKIINRELRTDDVFVEYVGKAQPDLYDVVFSWPESRDRVRLTLDGQVVFTTNAPETLSYELSNVQGGRKISVLVEVLDEQNHIIESKPRDLEIPKDYIFPKNYRLNNHMNITNERVFMSGSVITTQNFNLTIKTKNIVILEKSYLQNFNFSEKAQPAVSGRSGGEIRIEAETAEGELDITMNSEAGGDGFKGIASTECPASIGSFCMPHYNCPQGGNGWSAGANGNLYVKIHKVDNLKIFPQYTLSVGGNPGPVAGAATPEGYPHWGRYAPNNPKGYCPKHPVAGAEALPGKICLTYSGQVSEAGCE